MNQQPGCKERKSAASWDIYYSRAKDMDTTFQRLRLGDFPELTKKVKTQKNNNWTRIEIDLPLDSSRLTESTVSKYLSLENFSEDFRIFKNCEVFFFDDLNFVYYVVFNHNLKEVGRFIEVELNKDCVQTIRAAEGGEGPMAHLKRGEALLEKLGISPQNRLRKSLFEIYSPSLKP
jgi:adenylate cyclase class IV